MQEEEKFTEFLYVDKKKYMMILTISAGIFFFISLCLFKYISILFNIVTIIFLVGSFCILMLVMATNEVYNERFFKIMSGYYTVVLVYNFIALLPTGIENVIMSKKMIYFNTLLYVILAVVYLLISFYIADVSISSRKKSALILIAILVVGCVLFDKAVMVASIINIFVLICIFIDTVNNIGDFNIIADNKINYVIISAYCNFAVAILSLGMNLFEESKQLITILCLGVSFVAFIIQCMIIIEKLLTNPYKVLFKDLFNKNNEMNELNKQIVIKNRELEFSQMVIRKKEKMLRTFFSNVPVPLLIINSENRRIVFSNSNFMELVEEDNIKNVINKKLESIIQFEENYTNFSKEGFVRGVTEVNNELKYLDMEFVDVSENHDEIIVLLNDVTAKIRTDSIKESIQNKIFEERLKRDFLSNISHDLKTPINVIFSATQLLKYYIKQENSTSIRKYIKISKQNCITLIRLTNNLIDSSRIYSDFLSPTLEVRNIVQIIEEMVTSLIDYASNKEIELVFDTNQEEIYVSLDEEFMQRIILNLLSNSMKFTPKGGQITIYVKDNEDSVSVFVKDNGVGMDKAFLNNAFNRYSMEESNKGCIEKGTGIGLFVVKKLVEKQNGKIIVESEKNRGTNFELVFKKV